MGVVGGVIAFGFIGIFIGPTLLALAYALLTDWSLTRGEGAAPKHADSNKDKAAKITAKKVKE